MSLSKLTQSTVNGQFKLGLQTGPFDAWVNNLSIEANTPGQLSVPYGFVSEVPRLTKIQGGKGEDDTNRPLARKITILNEEYQTKETWRSFDQENDQTGELLRRTAEFGMECTHMRWRLIRDLILNGATSGYTSWDGQTFFDTDHSYDGSGTQKNKLTSSEVPSLAVTGSGTPTPEEFVTALVDTIAYGFRFVDGKGRPINQGETRVTVALPAALIGVGMTAVAANNLAGGKTNMLAVMQEKMGFAIDLITIPESTTPTVFHVFYTGNPFRKPFIFQTHSPATVKYLGVGSEYEIQNGAVLVRPHWAGAAGYGEPLKAIHATLD